MTHLTLNTKSLNRHMPTILQPGVFQPAGKSTFSSNPLRTLCSPPRRENPCISYRGHRHRRMLYQKMGRPDGSPTQRWRTRGEERPAQRKEGKVCSWVLTSEGITLLMIWARRPYSMAILAKELNRDQFL